MGLEPRTCCIRNCPRLGDDFVEFKQGQANGRELVSVLWFCGPHQSSWEDDEDLVVEASRVVVVVRRS